MRTTKRVVYPILLSAIQRGSKMLKSFILLWVFIMGTSILSKAQITFSSPTLPTGLEFTGSGAGSVQVGDLNGDGYADIIYNTASGGGITYLQNNAGLSFSTPASNPFAAFSASTPAGVVLTNAHLADFDRDGDLDLWVPVALANNDFYLRNDGNIFTSVALPGGMEFNGSGVASIKVADINKDGYPDIISNAAAGGGITYLQNNGGLFSTPGANPFAAFTVSSPAGTLFTPSCDIADYDGDGDLDVWVRISGADNDVYLRNDAGAYVIGAVPTGMEFTLAGGAAVVEVADFNGDGLIDIFFLSVTGGPVTYLQNNLGSFSTPTPNPFSAYSGGTPAGTNGGSAMNVADFDGDGDLDIWGRVAGAALDFYAVNSGTPPRLVSSTPARNATNIIRSTNITLVFSKPVYVGTGSFQIRRISDNSILETIAANGAAVSGSGTTTIVINPLSNLLSTTTYYLTFNRTALADAQGIIAGSLSINARTPASSPDFLSFTTSAVLPVTFGNLAAVLRNGELVVDWSTLSETNNDHFEIEASPDGQSFAIIGKTSSKAAGGNSATTISYTFTKSIPDGLLAAGIFLAALAGFKLRSRRKSLAFAVMMALAATVMFPACNKQSKDLANSENKIYIRVAQVDKDGTKSYSKVVTAQSE